MKIDLDKMDKIFPGAYFEISNGCAEPGYNDVPVIKADWNNVPDKVFDALESHGFSCEWLDEWTECHNCYRSVRNSPNSYGWQASYIIFNDWELLCLDCAEDYIEEYFESLHNNPKNALTTTILDRYNPENYGYVLIESKFENGLHEHMNDDPNQILERLLKDDPNKYYLFAMTDQSQFYITFAVYGKEKLT